MRRLGLGLLLLLLATPGWAQTPPPGFATPALSGNSWNQALGVAMPVSGYSVIQWATGSGAAQQVACTLGAIQDETWTVQVSGRIIDNKNRVRLLITRVAGANNDTATLDQLVENVQVWTVGPVNLGVDVAPNDRLGLDIAAGGAINANYWSAAGTWASQWRTVASHAYEGTAPATSYIGIGGKEPVNCTDFNGTLSAAGPTPDPPSIPLACGAIEISQFSMKLTCDASTGTVLSYEEQNCIGAGCSTWAPLRQTPATLYLSPGLTAATTYNHRRRACNATACSDWSATYQGTTLSIADIVAPTVPTNVHVVRIIGTSPIVNDAVIDWTPSTDVGGSGVERYTVEQGDENCANFVVVGETAHPTTSFVVTEANIPLLQRRCYRVKATDIAGNVSDYSAETRLHAVSGGAVR